MTKDLNSTAIDADDTAAVAGSPRQSNASSSTSSAAAEWEDDDPNANVLADGDEDDDEAYDDYYAADDDEEQYLILPQPSPPLRPLSARAIEWATLALHSRPIQAYLLIFTVYILFANDVRCVAFTKSADLTFEVLSTVCLFSFCVETIARSLLESSVMLTAEDSKSPSAAPSWRTIPCCRRHKLVISGYFLSFMFWLDLLALVSLLPEIQWIWGAVLAGSSASALSAARASRISRIGSRLGRILRVVRVVRVVKLYTIWSASHRKRGGKADDAEAATLLSLSGGGNDGLPRESAVGQQLNESTTRTIILLVLLMLLLIPVLTYTPFDAGRSTAAAMVHAANTLRVQMALSGAPPPSASSSTVWTAAVSSVLSQYRVWGAGSGVLASDVGSVMCVKIVLTPSAGVPAYLSLDEPWVYLNLRSDATAQELEQYDFSSTASDGSAVTTSVWFDVRPLSRLDAVYTIGLTLFVVFLLLLGALQFSVDAQTLVLRPIEGMLSLVERVSLDPAEAWANTDASSRDNTGTYETKVLENALKKVMGVLRVGLGSSGLQIVARHLDAGRRARYTSGGSSKVPPLGGAIGDVGPPLTGPPSAAWAATMLIEQQVQLQQPPQQRSLQHPQQQQQQPLQVQVQPPLLRGSVDAAVQGTIPPRSSGGHPHVSTTVGPVAAAAIDDRVCDSTSSPSFSVAPGGHNSAAAAAATDRVDAAVAPSGVNPVTAGSGAAAISPPLAPAQQAAMAVAASSVIPVFAVATGLPVDVTPPSSSLVAAHALLAASWVPTPFDASSAKSPFEPFRAGRPVRAVFVSIGIPHFDAMVEVLGPGVMPYFNRIAKIVHDVTLAWGGCIVHNGSDGTIMCAWLVDDFLDAKLKLEAARTREDDADCADPSSSSSRRRHLNAGASSAHGVMRGDEANDSEDEDADAHDIYCTDDDDDDDADGDFFGSSKSRRHQYTRDGNMNTVNSGGSNGNIDFHHHATNGGEQDNVSVRQNGSVHAATAFAAAAAAAAATTTAASELSQSAAAAATAQESDGALQPSRSSVSIASAVNTATPASATPSPVGSVGGAVDAATGRLLMSSRSSTSSSAADSMGSAHPVGTSTSNAAVVSAAVTAASVGGSLPTSPSPASEARPSSVRRRIVVVESPEEPPPSQPSQQLQRYHPEGSNSMADPVTQPPHRQLRGGGGGGGGGEPQRRGRGDNQQLAVGTTNQSASNTDLRRGNNVAIVDSTSPSPSPLSNNGSVGRDHQQQQRSMVRGISRTGEVEEEEAGGSRSARAVRQRRRSSLGSLDSAHPAQVLPQPFPSSAASPAGLSRSNARAPRSIGQWSDFVGTDSPLGGGGTLEQGESAGSASAAASAKAASARLTSPSGAAKLSRSSQQQQQLSDPTSLAPSPSSSSSAAAVSALLSRSGVRRSSLGLGALLTGMQQSPIVSPDAGPNGGSGSAVPGGSPGALAGARHRPRRPSHARPPLQLAYEIGADGENELRGATAATAVSDFNDVTGSTGGSSNGPVAAASSSSHGNLPSLFSTNATRIARSPSSFARRRPQSERRPRSERRHAAAAAAAAAVAASSSHRGILSTGGGPSASTSPRSGRQRGNSADGGASPMPYDASSRVFFPGASPASHHHLHRSQMHAHFSPAGNAPPPQQVAAVQEAAALLRRITRASLREAADRALLAVLRITAACSRSRDVQACAEAATLRESPLLLGHRLRLRFGVHAGWAIEGGLGSAHKVNAVYMGRAEIAARLRRATAMGPATATAPRAGGASASRMGSAEGDDRGPTGGVSAAAAAAYVAATESGSGATDGGPGGLRVLLSQSVMSLLSASPWHCCREVGVSASNGDIEWTTGEGKQQGVGVVEASSSSLSRVSPVDGIRLPHSSPRETDSTQPPPPHSSSRRNMTMLSHRSGLRRRHHRGRAGCQTSSTPVFSYDLWEWDALIPTHNQLRQQQQQQAVSAHADEDHFIVEDGEDAEATEAPSVLPSFADYAQAGYNDADSFNMCRSGLPERERYISILGAADIVDHPIARGVYSSAEWRSDDVWALSRKTR